MRNNLVTAKTHFNVHKRMPLDTVLDQSESRRQRCLFLSDNLQFILPATFSSL